VLYFIALGLRATPGGVEIMALRAKIIVSTGWGDSTDSGDSGDSSDSESELVVNKIY